MLHNMLDLQRESSVVRGSRVLFAFSERDEKKKGFRLGTRSYKDSLQRVHRSQDSAPRGSVL